uniref:Retrovirus-related Pol polyprotein from transposon TNT 1-94 n=1 Tax=Tanacetum cinerariifolium TaxID=118510 RepID=A0A6L2LQZ3_TANCI|nr:retrovirus-related Pol polyprotein from transposon TNT 1-94 [Tanacetum cinerariifolium]
MSCLPDDIRESVISCVSMKGTWTDLVHSFEGPSNTKENRMMNLKLEYQTFRAKSTKSLSQTYTCYMTVLNELANDGVNLSKHEINVGFVKSLPEKWLTFSYGLRNANHTQTLDLADIYERFVYEDNLIQRSQTNLKFQKDYKAEYKKMKAKLALLEASPPSPQKPKNKGLVAKIFDWDEEEVSVDEEVTQVKVLMALADDELTVGKSHARNGSTIELHSKLNKTSPSGSVCIFFLWTCLDQKKSQAPKMIMSFIRMVENQHDIKAKQIRTDNRIEFRNHELGSFCDDKGIFQNFSSPYTLKQNGVSKRKNRTLVEATRTMLNGSDYLGKFDAKADDGYFLGYSSVTKAFRVYNTRRQQIEETYHVTFDESMEAIRFTNTSVNEIGIDDSSRYPLESNLPQCMATKLTAASASEYLFADFLSEIEPKKVSEALKHPRWIAAMQEELNQFYRNKVWTLVLLPYRKITIGSKWVFRNKKDKHATTTKNKARLVAQGYSQEKGIDYDETFAPVAKMEAIRIFLSFTTYMNFKVYQMDVKSALLNGKLKEKVYVKYPSRFESNEFPNYVCKLDKALYGLKQAPKACSSVKTPMVPPNNLVLCARYQSAPKESHLTAMKRILMYLKGTLTLGLYYLKCSNLDLKGYSDLDYFGCNMDKKSTPGACQILDRKLACWSAKKQQSVVMSLAKAEYVATAGCCASIPWMKIQLSDYDIHYKIVPMFCDKTSTIAISNNLVLHSRTKHIDIRYHFIRDHILKGDIELHFILTEHQLADIFTKPLDELTLTRLKVELGMLNID